MNNENNESTNVKSSKTQSMNEEKTIENKGFERNAKEKNKCHGEFVTNNDSDDDTVIFEDVHGFELEK